MAAAHELNKMFKDTVRLLPRITAPVRVYRSSVDHVVSDSSIAALRRGLTHAPLEVIRLENSYHVATMDNDAAEIFRGSAEFIRSVAGRPATRAPPHSQPEGHRQMNRPDPNSPDPSANQDDAVWLDLVARLEGDDTVRSRTQPPARQRPAAAEPTAPSGRAEAQHRCKR